MRGDRSPLNSSQRSGNTGRALRFKIVKIERFLNRIVPLCNAVPRKLRAAIFIYYFNPLGPHDALKHHFTSLKTDLIFLQQSVLERKFPCNWFTNT